MKRGILLSTLLLSGVCVSAQTTMPVTGMKYMESVSLREPIKSDTIDVKGKSYETAALLKNTATGMFDESAAVVNDDQGRYLIAKPDKGYALHRFKFNIMPNRYSTLKIEIKAPGMYEVYVNGEKKGDKYTLNTKLSDTKQTQHTITAEPEMQEVIIKYLNSASIESDDSLWVAVSCPKEDSLSHPNITPDPRHPLYIDDLLVGKRPSSTSISPDGKFVLIQYRTTFAGGGGSTESVLYRIADGQQQYIKEGLSWMPSSPLLYYVRNTDNGRELRTIDPENMQEQLLASGLPAGHFTWSPDETFLIYSVYESAPEKGKPIIEIMEPSDRIDGWRNRCNLYKYDLASGVMQRLTFGYRSTNLLDISGDGTKLLFNSSYPKLTERPFGENSVFLLDLATGNIDTLWHKDPFAGNAQFSPDGTQILIAAPAEAFGGLGLNIQEGQTSNMYDMQAYIMNLADKKITPITRQFNPSIESAVWNSFDNQIYFRCTDKDYVTVYKYAPQKEAFEKLPLEEDIVQSFQLSKNAPVAIYRGQSTSYANRVHLYNTKKNKSELIADPQAEQMAQLRLAPVTDWNFQTEDGSTIEGRYYLPPNFDENKQYPMIVYYYGGTTPTDRSFEMRYSGHLYAAMGYVVYVIQPSGTIGYGQEFSARHVNAWGIKTADDIITGTQKFCEAHPFVNPKKVGCIGASYGGFMTQYLQTQTNIFAAAVSHAGISSISSYWGEGYWGYGYSAAASANSYPWNNKELYVEQSPLFHADKINTPLLLIHGTVDTNVPIGESIQMFAALKILGKEVAFLQVEGENHGIVDFKKRMAWKKSIFAWFAKWLQDDPAWWDSLYPEKTL